MARLITCGWESGDLNEIGTYLTYNGGSQSFVSGRSGRYGYRSTSISGGGMSMRSVSLGASPNPNELWIRIGFANVYVFGARGESFLDLMDGSAIQVQFGSKSDTILRAYRGTTEIVSGGALSGGSTYSCLELHVIIHSTNGVIQAWIDGALVFSFTGNTQASPNAYITDIRFGIRYQSSSGGSYYDERCDIDDIAVNDTTGSVNNSRIGQGGIIALYPNADTTDKDFSRSAGSSNYSLVNSFPPDGDASYVESGVIGDCDLYELEDPSGDGTINAVWVTTHGRVVLGAGAPIGITLRSGATTVVASAYSLTNTYTMHGRLFNTDPNTSAAWTPTALNSLQIGVTVV